MQPVLKTQYISLFPEYRGAENSMPELHEVIGGTKTKIYCQATVLRTYVLVVLRTVKVELSDVGNQAKPTKYEYSENNVIYYQLRPDVQTHGHPPRYKADADADADSQRRRRSGRH